jgi:hypothetical protein
VGRAGSTAATVFSAPPLAPPRSIVRGKLLRTIEPVCWRRGGMLFALLLQAVCGPDPACAGSAPGVSSCFSRNSTQIYSGRILRNGPDGAVLASRHISRGERILSVPLSCTLGQHSPAADGLYPLAQSLVLAMAPVPPFAGAHGAASSAEAGVDEVFLAHVHFCRVHVTRQAS